MGGSGGSGVAKVMQLVNNFESLGISCPCVPIDGHRLATYYHHDSISHTFGVTLITDVVMLLWQSVVMMASWRGSLGR